MNDFSEDFKAKQNIDEKAQVNELIRLNNAIKNYDNEEIINILKSKVFLEKRILSILIEIFNNYANTDEINVMKIKEMILSIIINSNVDINKIFELKVNNNPFLIITIIKKDFLFTKKLLELKRDFNVNIIDNKGKNLLMHAIINSNSEDENLINIVKILISKNILINSESNEGHSALTLCAKKNFIEIAKLLLDANASLNQQVKADKNRSCLHYAVIENNVEMVKLLIKYKPNINIKDDNNLNPLQLVTKHCVSTEIYEILAEYTNQINEINKIQSQKNKLSLEKIIGNSNKNTPILNKVDSSINPEHKTKTLNFSKDSSTGNNTNSNTIDMIKSFSKNLLDKSYRIPSYEVLKSCKIKSLIEETSYIPKKKIKERVDKKESQLVYKLEQEIQKLNKKVGLLTIENEILKSKLKQEHPSSLLEIKNDINQINQINQIKNENIFPQNNLNSNNIINCNSNESNYFDENVVGKYLMENKIEKSYSVVESRLSLSNLELLSNTNRKEYLIKKFSTIHYSSDYINKMLTKDILDFQEYNKMEIQLIKPTIDKLLSLINEAVTESINFFDVNLYGSHATGLCLSWSDLDVVLVPKKGYDHYFYNYSNNLHPLYLRLCDKPWIKQIKYIDTATIPLIKIEATNEFKNMQIDISIQDSKHMGLKCVELVKEYINQFEALEPLLYVLKNLLKNANLNDPYTGGISSYGLILMLVSFLYSQKNHNKDISIKSSEKSNLGILFTSFCYYYGYVFDHEKYLINAIPLNGNENYQEKISFLNYEIMLQDQLINLTT